MTHSILCNEALRDFKYPYPTIWGQKNSYFVLNQRVENVDEYARISVSVPKIGVTSRIISNQTLLRVQLPLHFPVEPEQQQRLPATTKEGGRLKRPPPRFLLLMGSASPKGRQPELGAIDF